MDLLTEAEARAYLGAENSDEPSSDWFGLVIPGVSNSIARKAGRDYSGGGENEQADTREFQRFGDDSTISIDDCRDITFIEAGYNGDWSEIPAETWTAEPTKDPVKRGIRFAKGNMIPASGVGWVFGGRSASATPWPNQSSAETTAITLVRVTAKWGCGGVPANVKLAALMWISSLKNRDAAYFSENFAKGAATILDIPPDVLSMISDETGNASGVGAV